VDGEAAVIVQDLEAPLAHAAHVVVDHELIDLLLEQFERPPAAAHLFRLLRGKDRSAHRVAVRRIEILHLLRRRGVRRLFPRREAALDAICVIAAGIGP
jgi:hypothetical protein